MRWWPFGRKAPKKRTPRRSYTAAAVNRLTANWSSSSIRPDAAVRQNLTVLRARSREQTRNNEYARRAVGMFRDNVAGPDGIMLQAQTRNPSGQLDSLANQAIETAWKRWGQPEHCHMGRRLSWTEFQRVFIASAATDGEAIVRLHRGPHAGDPYRFSVSLIDPDRLDVEYNEKFNNGYVRAGIEFDNFNRPVAYNFLQEDPSRDARVWKGKAYTRIPAAEILHCFVQDYAFQTRGVPWMAAGLFSLQQVGAYKEAAIMAARAGASKLGFYMNEEGVDEGVGDEIDSDGSLIQEFDPMSITQLPAGTEFQGFDPAYPSNEFGPFIKACLQGFASSVNISYNTLANDLEGVSFSGLKSGKDDERNGYRVLQEWMATCLCRPVYRAWLRQQLLTNTITVNGAPLNIFRAEKYEDVRWQGYRWPAVDPEKQAKAFHLSLEDGVTTRADQIRATSGRDPVEVFEEWEREKSRFGVPVGAGAGVENGPDGEGESDG